MASTRRLVPLVKLVLVSFLMISCCGPSNLIHACLVTFV